MASNNKSNRGFAAMDPEKQRQIAAKGGRASHGGGNRGGQNQGSRGGNNQSSSR